MIDGMMHLIDNNTNEYMFKQVTNDFNDIINHWAKDDIDFISARGLVSGTNRGRFSPNDPMTRGCNHVKETYFKYSSVNA